MRLPTLIAVVLSLGAALAAPAQEPPAPKPQPKEETVVITASRLEEPPRDVASSLTVIPEADLRRGQHRFVVDALREVPALDVVQSGARGGLTSVFLRGANSEHTLVLIDGVEANDPMSSGRAFDFAHLTSDNIDRIEILRGPQSVLYGSDAMGGVVNVLTRRGRGDPRTSFMLEGGSMATYRGSVSVAGGTDRVHYSLGASRAQSAGISSASSDEAGNHERDGYLNESFSARVGVIAADWLEVDVFARAMNGQADVDDGGGAGLDDDDHTAESTQWLFRVAPRVRLLDGQWEQTLGFSLTSLATEDDDAPEPGNPTAYTFSSFDSRTVDLDWQHDFKVFQGNVLTFGAEFEEDTGESASDFGGFVVVFPRTQVWTRGAYLQDRLHVWDAVTLTGGIRVDDHEEFGTHGTYRGTGAYYLKRTSTKIRGTVGTGFKAPSLFQLFSSFGDPDLEPEESLGWDVGIDQDLFEGVVTASVTYYRNDFEELINFDGGLNKFVNVGEAETSGVEAALRVFPLEVLELRFSYTLTETEDESTGEELLRRPRHKAGARALWAVTPAVHVNASVLYVGERDDLDFSTFPATRVTLADYGVANLAGSWRIDERFEVFGRVENLFDTEYEEIEGFGVAGAAVYIGGSASF
jgi:vitamin B12 transporter